MPRSRLCTALVALIGASVTISVVRYATWSAASPSIATVRERLRSKAAAAHGPNSGKESLTRSVASLSDAELISSARPAERNLAPESGRQSAVDPPLLALAPAGDDESGLGAESLEFLNEEEEGEFLAQADIQARVLAQRRSTKWCWHGSCEPHKAPPFPLPVRLSSSSAAAAPVANASRSLATCPSKRAAAALRTSLDSDWRVPPPWWSITCDSAHHLQPIRELGFGACKRLTVVLAPSRPEDARRSGEGRRWRKPVLAILKVSGIGGGGGTHQTPQQQQAGFEVDGSDSETAASAASAWRSSCVRAHEEEVIVSTCLEGLTQVPTLLGACVGSDSVLSVHLLVADGFDLGAGVIVGSSHADVPVPEAVADADSARLLSVGAKQAARRAVPESSLSARRRERQEKQQTQQMQTQPTEADAAAAVAAGVAAVASPAPRSAHRLPAYIRREAKAENRRLLGWALAKQMVLLASELARAGAWFETLDGSAFVVSKAVVGDMHEGQHKIPRLWLVDTSGIRIGPRPARLLGAGAVPSSGLLDSAGSRTGATAAAIQPPQCATDEECPPTSELHCCCGELAFAQKWACRGSPEAAGICHVARRVCAPVDTDATLGHALANFAFLLPSIQKAALPELRVVMRALSRDVRSERPLLEQVALWLDRNAAALLSGGNAVVDRANLTAPARSTPERSALRAARSAREGLASGASAEIEMRSTFADDALSATETEDADMAGEAAEEAALLRGADDAAANVDDSTLGGAGTSGKEVKADLLAALAIRPRVVSRPKPADEELIIGMIAHV